MQLRCVKDDIAAFLQLPFGANGPPTEVQPELFGVSNTMGTQQWSVDLTGKGVVGCSYNGAYVMEPSSSSNNSILNVHAMRDGTVTWSVPFGAPVEAPVNPNAQSARLHRQRGNHLVIVVYCDGQFRLRALELPDGQQGSVRWTLPLPVEMVSYFYDGPDRIFVMLQEGDDVYSVVRLALSDGSRMWTRSGSGTATPGTRRSGPESCCCSKGRTWWRSRPTPGPSSGNSRCTTTWQRPSARSSS